MNGRTSKLLRKTFSPGESPLKRREYRRFKKAYTGSDKAQQTEVRRVATKIKAVQDQGGEVKQFRINPETNQAEPVEKGDKIDERPSNSKNPPSPVSRRKGHHQEKS